MTETIIIPPASKTLETIKKILPIVPLRNVVLFPSVDTSIFVGRKQSSRAIMEGYDKYNKLVIVTTQRNPKTENPQMADLYSVGVLSRIEHILQTDGSLHAIVHGISRVNIVKINQYEPFMTAEFVDLPQISESVTDIQQSADALLSQLKKAFAMGRQFDLPAVMQLGTGVSSSDLADQVAFAVEGKLSEKQAILETLLVSQRIKVATELLIREMKVAELEKDIEAKTQEKFNTGMKRNILEERKHQIEKELKRLGKSSGDKDSDANELATKLKKAKMPPELKKKALKELNRLEEMGSMAPESSYIRTYLETLVDLPWGKYTKDNLDLKKAEKILNDDHYGLQEVKERILEYLAVMNLRGKQKENGEHHNTNILCFIGPPGVGKTSLGKSIAKALGREFVRISLGGVRDEAEIRGHRRTYVGAMPGRIIKGLKDAKSFNPVFMLDEIDKLASDYRGDPASALLETLDPEQNKEFTDHYIDSPVDLSKVFFILTGNDLAGLPGPLLDRVEVIDFTGYTLEEKFHIAKKYLLPKQLSSNGLVAKDVGVFKDDTIRYLTEKYTREAGVRNLERLLAKLFRKVAKQIVTKADKVEINNTKVVQKLLGPERYSSPVKGKKDEVGISTGLAWTSVGGDVLFIETNIMKGRGSLILTGKLGTVMKESCQAAVSYIRSQADKFGITQDFHKTDIHIHFPEGATPKDGPSAGCAITTSLISALKNVPIPKDIAMTGEITIRGNVLPIGGLKEKTIAAHRAGIKTLIIPKENEKNMVDVPEEVQKDIKFIFAEHYSEIYKIIFKK